MSLWDYGLKHVKVPSHVGSSAVHISLAWHVMESSPDSVYPLLQENVTESLKV